MSSTDVRLSKADLPGDTTVLSHTGIVQFDIGMKVEVDYVNPTDGWTIMWLEDNQQNVVLSFSARMDERALVLNSRVDGKWGSEKRPSGYDFTPGVSQHISLESEQDYFIIRVNNNDVHHYTYRLPPTAIHKVVVHYRKSGAGTPTQLKGVTYKYR